jgi:hypothetical protein
MDNVAGKLIGAVAVIGFSYLSLGASPALAKSDCACLANAPAAGQMSGSVTSVVGNVQISGPTGYSQAQSGASLVPGSHVMTGADGKVSLRVRGCDLHFGANSDISVIQTGSKICVRGSTVSASESTYGIGGSATGQGLVTPFALFAGTVGTLGVVAGVSSAIGGGGHAASK